jgi:type IV pilus assembly protein PilW
MNMRNLLMCHNLSRQCRGFSLVELMVALVISLILMAGIGQIFLGSKKSFTIQDSLGRMQENGRYAMGILTQDLRRAGYWGGNADIGAIEGSQAPDVEDGTCANGDTTWGIKLDHRIFGKDDNRTGYDCLPADPAHTGDVLVVRYAAPWVIGGITTGPSYMADYPNRYFLRSSLFEGRLFKGGDEANTENLINAPAERTAELVARGYFIHTSESSDATKCPGSDAVPSLYRMVLDNDGTPKSEEVAYGVDDFQVQYGLDTDDDNSVDSFVDAAGPTDVMWDQVIAARIWLLVRAECPETGYTNDTTYTMAGVDSTYGDGYRRQLYTSTVKLRNSF